jgi:hypothetical protein
MNIRVIVLTKIDVDCLSHSVPQLESHAGRLCEPCSVHTSLQGERVEIDERGEGEEGTDRR